MKRGRIIDRNHKARHSAIAKPKHASHIVAQLDLYICIYGVDTITMIVIITVIMAMTMIEFSV